MIRRYQNVYHTHKSFTMIMVNWKISERIPYTKIVHYDWKQMPVKLNAS